MSFYPQTSTGAVGSQGTNKKSLTESTATTFINIAVPSSTTFAASCFAAGYINYTIFAADASNFQARSGILNFVIVNKAGALTMLGFRADGTTTIDNTTDGVAASSGTLTNTFTLVDQGSNSGVCNVKANAVSSLTQTTLDIYYSVVISSGSADVRPAA